MASGTIRLMITLKSVNQLMYSLLVTLEQISVTTLLASLLTSETLLLQMYCVVLVIIMYSYAALASYMFSSNQKFSTVLDSFTTMFQLMVGEGWHEVTWSAITAILTVPVVAGDV